MPLRSVGVRAAQDFTVVIDVIPVGGIVPPDYTLYGMQIDTPTVLTARNRDKAEKQQPMTLLEKDFLEESGMEIDSGEKK